MQQVEPKDILLSAMNLLARREHLRGELAHKLYRRFGRESGAGAVDMAEMGMTGTKEMRETRETREMVDAVLDQLGEDGLQSDQRCIESYIRQRASRGYGPERIRRELEQKGAESEAVGAALDVCGEDWLDLARKVRLKKFGSGEPRGFAEKSKQMRFLNYRGFPGELSARLFSF